MPLTFSQAWTIAKNAVMDAFRPALEELNNLLNSDIGRNALNGLITATQLAGQALTWHIGLVERRAQWVQDNWEAVSTVLIGLTLGVAAVMTAAAIAHLLAGLADWALGILESIARAIDWVFGGNLADAVSGWRSNVQDWADSFGQNEIKIQRMEKLRYDDAWATGSKMGGSVGAALDNFSLEDILGNIGGTPFDYEDLPSNAGISSTLTDIAADTRTIRNSVALSEEDIKLLVDLAEREYITKVNLTAQTPIITVNGQNSGDTELDRQQLAEAIRDILVEQAASHTDRPYT